MNCYFIQATWWLTAFLVKLLDLSMTNVIDVALNIKSNERQKTRFCENTLEKWTLIVLS